MWLKFRYKWSSHIGEWSWKDLGDMTPKAARDLVKEDTIPSIDLEYDWSEHYRGIDYKICKHAPIEVIKKSIKLAEENIQRQKEKVSRFKQELLVLELKKNPKKFIGKHKNVSRADSSVYLNKGR